MNDSSSGELSPLLSEHLVLEAWPKWSERVSHASDTSRDASIRALVVSPGRAQTASHILASLPTAHVQAWYLDMHDAMRASDALSESVEVLCGADLPEGEVDLVVMPVLKRSEAELTRDLLQQAHHRLRTGGLLVTAVDHAKDNWLHDQMKSMFDKVTCERMAKGCVYWARKSQQLKKTKNFECQFDFRDDGRTIQVVSRPGVFSHRRLDAGAKQLMLSAEIGPSDHVLDMGTGAGSVALAVAGKTEGHVYGVDSNARAVDCLRKGAELNELSNIHPMWNADGVLELDVPIDIALANPPYFGDDQISQHFVDACLSVLRPGGALLVVTKRTSWYEAYFEQLLEDIVIFEAASYFVICGRTPSLT